MGTSFRTFRRNSGGWSGVRLVSPVQDRGPCDVTRGGVLLPLVGALCETLGSGWAL